MFDALFPEQTDIAINAKAMRPPEPDPNARRFSAWGMLGAAPKGVAAGSAQALGSTADVAKGTGENWLGNLNGPLGRIPMFGAVQALVKTGQDMLNPTEGKYTSEVGTSLRNVAQDYTPDPQTTHAAESAVFNLFRVGSKAVTAAATMGNLPGAVLAGFEEGLTQSDELARQGVDINTRTKVGAVTAATNAVGFALPAAGKTWLQTGALAIAGGPVSFMAQNAATREILQNADYTKLADQYDPFDPVGLALSTVVPLGFGAMAMRGAKGKAAPAPDAPPKVAPPDEVVDAARVTLVRQQMDAANPVPDRLDMADAHVKAYTQAMDQMAAGERVQVGDIAPADAPKITEWAATVAKAAEAQKQAAAVTVEIKPDTNFLQAKTEAGMVGGTIRDGALHINYAEVDPAMRGQGEGIKLYSALIDDALSRGLRVFSDATVEAPAVRVYEALQRRGYEVKRLGGGVLEDGTAYGKGAKDPAFEIVGKTEQPPAAKTAAAADAAKPADAAPTFNPTALANEATNLLAGGKTADQVIGELQATGAKVSPELQNMVIGVSEFGGRVNDLVDQVKALQAQRGANAQGFDLIAQAVDNLRSGRTVEAKAPADPLEKALADMADRNPTALDAEIPIEFDADGKPAARMTVRDYIDMVKREASQDAADADLIEVAATCFLTGGL